MEGLAPQSSPGLGFSGSLFFPSAADYILPRFLPRAAPAGVFTEFLLGLHLTAPTRGSVVRTPTVWRQKGSLHLLQLSRSRERTAWLSVLSQV